MKNKEYNYQRLASPGRQASANALMVGKSDDRQHVGVTCPCKKEGTDSRKTLERSSEPNQ